MKTLPKFLYNKLINKKTSLGDNSVFPLEEDYRFDYLLIKKRYNEIQERLETSEFGKFDIDSIENKLSELIIKCKEKEKPLKENLIKICENFVNEKLGVPSDTIELECELVDRISPRRMFRLTPESSDNRNFDFDDMEDMSNVSKVILKRRFINSLILGISYHLSNTSNILNEIYQLDNELPKLYDNIRLLSDYLLFNKQEHITDKNPMQGSCVEVELGSEGEKTLIQSQGLILPFLLNDTIRGFFELFSSHGLPKDNKRANYIISQADFLMAEPWDLRFGVGLWDIIGESIDDTRLLPYYFMNLCELNVDEFNNEVKEILGRTKHGKSFKEELISISKHDFEMNYMVGGIKQKNDSNKSLIADEYISDEELDDIIVEDETNIENIDYISLIKNCTSDDIYIDLECVNAQHGWFNCVVQINDIDLPLYVIDAKCESVQLEDGEIIYFPHIDIGEDYQHMGLGYKTLKAFIECVGSIAHSYTRTYNKGGEMNKIYTKLGNENNITTTDYFDDNGNVEYVVARLSQKI